MFTLFILACYVSVAGECTKIGGRHAPPRDDKSSDHNVQILNGAFRHAKPCSPALSPSPLG